MVRAVLVGESSASIMATRRRWRSTVQSLAQRYHVDLQQARRVEDTALALLSRVADAWQLRLEDARQWLHWAALLHEIGLVIAHSQYHKHGAYLVEHSDLPGFSLRDQRLLSVLVRCHRRKFRSLALDVLPDNLHDITIRMCILLRLAVLLHRNRSRNAPPVMDIDVEGITVNLAFPDEWLEEHPLTRADLKLERKHLKNIGVALEYR
jgi:exopolyphosphatase/guanosine-5'-triphosphate,3'-diphosphate pyrophosphatase